MDNELAQVKAIAKSADFSDNLVLLYIGGGSWRERFARFADEMMTEHNLECLEHDVLSRSVVLYPHGTKRKRPAFIAVHPGSRSLYDFVSAISTAVYTIEVVEAGKHGVAGTSEATPVRREAEDTALFR